MKITHEYLRKKMSTVLNDKNNENVSLMEKYECCFGCCGCLGILGLIGACIAFEVFGIIFLVEDFTIAWDCSDSYLWVYVLISLLQIANRSKTAKTISKEGISDSIGILFCAGILELGMCIWGGVELFNKSCNDLSHSNLWIYGAFVFSLQLFICFLVLFAIPCCFCCISICKDRNTDEHQIPSKNILDPNPDIESQTINGERETEIKEHEISDVLYSSIIPKQ